MLEEYTFCWSEINTQPSPSPTPKSLHSKSQNQSHESFVSFYTTAHAIGYIELLASLPTAHNSSPLFEPLKKQPSKPTTFLHPNRNPFLQAARQTYILEHWAWLVSIKLDNNYTPRITPQQFQLIIKNSGVFIPSRLIYLLQDICFCSLALRCTDICKHLLRDS